jgi:hypothetical protein
MATKKNRKRMEPFEILALNFEILALNEATRAMLRGPHKVLLPSRRAPEAKPCRQPLAYQ